MGKSNKNNKLQIFAVAFGVLTAYAYLIGMCYHQGYMESFGVSSDYFSLPTADIYISAFFAITLLCVDVINWLKELVTRTTFYMALIFAIGIFLIVIKCVKYLKRNFQATRVSNWLEKLNHYFHFDNNDLTKSLTVTGIFAYLITGPLYIIAFSVILVWLLPVNAISQGKQQSNKKVAHYVKYGCSKEKATNWNNCILIIDNKGALLHEGLWIAKNSSEIAIFKKDGSYLIQLNDAHIVRKKYN